MGPFMSWALGGYILKQPSGTAMAHVTNFSSLFSYFLISPFFFFFQISSNSFVNAMSLAFSIIYTTIFLIIFLNFFMLMLMSLTSPIFLFLFSVHVNNLLTFLNFIFFFLFLLSSTSFIIFYFVINISNYNFSLLVIISFKLSKKLILPLLVVL